MERKQFIERLLISSGSALILSSSLLSCEKDEIAGNGPGGIPPGGDIIIDLTDSKYSSLLNQGGFVYVSGIIVANAGSDTFLALDSTCTHEGCTVTFSLASTKFPCGCHGSEFSSTGSVLQGPATRSLKRYNVTKDGNKLTIS